MADVVRISPVLKCEGSHFQGSSKSFDIVGLDLVVFSFAVSFGNLPRIRSDVSDS